MSIRIRYVGHFGEPSGYGRAATELARALQRAGALLDIVPMNFKGDLPLATTQFSDVDAVIIHTLPMDCAGVLEKKVRGQPVAPPNRPVVAYTTWESIQPPQGVVASLWKRFADVWVPSKATSRIGVSHDGAAEVSAATVIPHTYDAVDTYAGPSKDANPQPFTFYYVGAWTARKNPVGLLRAYLAEFRKTDDVELYIHSSNADRHVVHAHMASTGIPQSERAEVAISTSIASDDGIRQLHRESDCFVTASRGEAWNMPAFEALQARRMIISPGELGSDDFLLDTDSVLYVSSPAPAWMDVSVGALDPKQPGAVPMVVSGPQGMTCRDSWREPDLIELRRMMRRVYEMKKRDNIIHYNLAAEFGYRAVGNKVLAELEKHA